MGTTTIRLPAELKAQMERVAAARGASAHAFMLDAIAEVAQRLSSQQDFEARGRAPLEAHAAHRRVSDAG